MTNQQRLYAIVLRISALRPGAIPADHGDLARAALLKLIQQGDSPLAQRLHDDNAQKPYTISPISGGRRSADKSHHFGEGDSAEWRFTLMIEPAFEALLRRYLLDRATPHLRIGAVDFAVADAFASGASHPDSGHVGMEELTDRWNVPPETLKRQITLDFRSPTAFNFGQDKETRQRRIHNLPDAQTVFSALRNKWKQLGGLDPGIAFDTWVGDSVETEPIRIQLQRANIEDRTIEGVVGRVRYRVYGKDIRWLPMLHLLSQLTFWTGIGYQTTCGLGQVRPIPD